MTHKECRWPHIANATYTQPEGKTGQCRDPWCLRSGSCALSARLPREVDKPAQRFPRILHGWSWVTK